MNNLPTRDDKLELASTPNLTLERDADEDENVWLDRLLFLIQAPNLNFGPLLRLTFGNERPQPLLIVALLEIKMSPATLGTLSLELAFMVDCQLQHHPHTPHERRLCCAEAERLQAMARRIAQDRLNDIEANATQARLQRQAITDDPTVDGMYLSDKPIPPEQETVIWHLLEARHNFLVDEQDRCSAAVLRLIRRGYEKGTFLPPDLKKVRAYDNTNAIEHTTSFDSTGLQRLVAKILPSEVMHKKDFWLRVNRLFHGYVASALYERHQAEQERCEPLPPLFLTYLQFQDYKRHILELATASTHAPIATLIEVELSIRTKAHEILKLALHARSLDPQATMPTFGLALAQAVSATHLKSTATLMFAHVTKQNEFAFGKRQPRPSPNNRQHQPNKQRKFAREPREQLGNWANDDRRQNARNKDKVDDKKKVCSYFMAGKCNRGNSCRFHHPQQKPRQQPKLPPMPQNAIQDKPKVTDLKQLRRD